MENGPYRLVLASSSPRRQEIVRGLAEHVACVPPDVEEAGARQGESPEELALSLSLKKARRVAEMVGLAMVLGADTLVVLGGEVLGKPGSAEEATDMLRRLKGRTHRVVTGVTVLDGRTGRTSASARASEVTMRRYSEGEIGAYVASGEPFDKAGAYAAQDVDFRPAASIEGCYLNVVGLPLCEVVTLLEGMGVSGRLRAGWSPPAECIDCTLGPRSEVVFQ